MFFIVSKLTGFFTYPILWILILLIIGLLKKRTIAKNLYIGTAFFIFFVISNSFLTGILTSWWTIPIVPISEVKCYDIGIVLGGGSSVLQMDPNRSYLNQAGNRVVQAIELYKKGVIKKVLFSGGAGNLTGKNRAEARTIKNFFTECMIPDSAYIMEETSKNTYENAKFTAAILKNSFPNAKCILITSALHMRRSLDLFKKQGIECLPYSSEDVSNHDVYEIDYYVLPRVEAIQKWHDFLHELVGYVSYKVVGYL